MNGQITELIRDASLGDTQAQDRLYAVVLPKLRELAQVMMRHERAGHTLQPTALVNELAVKLLGENDRYEDLPNTAAFFSLAAKAMRNLLVDHARRRAAAKRKGTVNAHQIPLEEVVQFFQQTERLDLLALDEALDRLKENSERQHEVVMLRYFGGLDAVSISAHLGVSRSTVDKDWQFARAWLRRELRKGES